MLTRSTAKARHPSRYATLCDEEWRIHSKPSPRRTANRFRCVCADMDGDGDVDLDDRTLFIDKLLFDPDTACP
jgi:hypothetical protein